jgi:hypothetical protein
MGPPRSVVQESGGDVVMKADRSPSGLPLTMFGVGHGTVKQFHHSVAKTYEP